MMTWKQLRAMWAAGALLLAMVATCAAQRAEPNSAQPPAANSADTKTSQEADAKPPAASAQPPTAESPTASIEPPAASATEATPSDDANSESAPAPAANGRPSPDPAPAAEAQAAPQSAPQPPAADAGRPPESESKPSAARSAPNNPTRASAGDAQPMRLGPILDQMDLSDAQRAQIQSVLKSTRQQVALARNDRRLSYDQKSDKINSLRASMRQRVTAILTPEQLRQARQIAQQQQRRGQMMGQPDGSQPPSADVARPPR